MLKLQEVRWGPPRIAIHSKNVQLQTKGAHVHMLTGLQQPTNKQKGKDMSPNQRHYLLWGAGLCVGDLT